MLKLEYIDTIKYEAGRSKALFLIANKENLKNSKVAIFGNGIEAYLINDYLCKKNICVDFFINNDLQMSEKIFCNKNIVTLNKVDKNYYIIVAMTMPKYNNEVLWQLKVNGYKNFGLAFIEFYHAFSGNKNLDTLQDIVLKEINKILCEGKEIEEIIKPVFNVGPAGNLLGHIPELCWTTTWSDYLLKWFYEQYKTSTDTYHMLEIGPGMGVFSAAVHQINPNIKIQWLMFSMDRKSKVPVCDKYASYPANQFEIYEGMIEEPNFYIDNQYDIIVMTEVIEHFVNNPIPTMKKIANMLNENGKLYLSTPDWGHLRIYSSYKEIPEYTTLEDYKERYIGHTFQYYKQELEEILDQCGLKIEKYALSDSKNHNLIARRR